MDLNVLGKQLEEFLREQGEPAEDAALSRTDRGQEWELLSGLTARSKVPIQLEAAMAVE